jgi:hypothetical protein
MSVRIPRPGKRQLTDATALNYIAVALGASEEWDSGALEDIAEWVRMTGRPQVGDQSDADLAMYRRAADRLGIGHDGD